MLHRILVPLDGTRYADHALPYAVALAVRTGATLEFVHVHHHHEYDPDLAALPQYQFQHIAEVDSLFNDETRSAEKAQLEAKAAEIELRYGVNVLTRVLSGHTAQALSREAADLVADLIVMTTHAREGIERIRFGDVAHDLIVNLNVPAICIRPESGAAPLVAPEIHRMLIPIDGSPFSEQILDVAAPLVQALGAIPTLAHVAGARPLFGTDFDHVVRSGFGTRDQATSYLCSLAERYRDRLPDPELVALEAVDPASCIAQLIACCDYDLVAMATHGRSGLSRLFLGSVAEKVLRQTRTPVLLYRPRSVPLPAEELDAALRITGE
jgi:nucleotide-binding universal stress UspA family protein